MTGIYEIRNLTTGQRYIGSSGDLKSRLRDHLSSLKNDRHRNKRLQRAWNQYGQECFEFRVLAILEHSEQLFIEQRWLHYVNKKGERGYNVQRFTGFLTYTHGLRSTMEYGIWASMKNRCLNPKVKNYDDYGGRGITVCIRWQKFRNWYTDIGPRPIGGMLERLDNNGHYSCGICQQCIENEWPLNVIWATRAQQAKNKRNTRLITANGQTHHLAEWARILKGTPGAILHRIDMGWTEEAAVTTPIDMKATVTAMRQTPEWKAAQSARTSAWFTLHPRAMKLTEAEQDAIYLAYPAQNSDALAKQYHVSPPTIRKVIRKKKREGVIV